MNKEKELARIEASCRSIGIGLARQYSAGLISPETYWNGVDNIERTTAVRKAQFEERCRQRELKEAAREKYRSERRLAIMEYSK